MKNAISMLQKKQHELLSMLVSLLTTGIILYVFYQKCGVYFDTNDERYMIHIMSGSLTGKPDPHIICSNYLLGLLFSGLYTLTAKIPWFGLFLVSCYYVCFTCILYCLLRKSVKLLEMTAYWFLGCLFVCMNLYIFCEMQFTTTAGVLAATGYFVLLQNRKKNIVLFAVFELLALFLRVESMLMVQAIGMLVVGTILLIELYKKEISFQGIIKEILCYLGVIALTFLISLTGDYVIGDRSSKEWKDYYEYNELRVDLFDYYGFPYDENVEKILQKHGVTELDYRSFATYWMLDTSIDNDCLREIRDYAKTKYVKQKQSISEILDITWREYKGINEWGYHTGFHVYMKVLLIFLAVMIILKKKYINIFPLTVLESSKLILMFYLVYNGRYPFRVTAILFFAELLFMIFLIQQIGMDFGKCVWKKILIAGCALFLIKEVVSNGRVVYAAIREDHAKEAALVGTMNELFDYWSSDSAGYILDTFVLMFYTGEVLDTKWHEEQTFFWCGGWFYKSPSMNEAEERYIEEHKDNLRMLVRKDTNYHILARLEEQGVECNVVDTIQNSDGKIYDVYQLTF